MDDCSLNTKNKAIEIIIPNSTANIYRKAYLLGLNRGGLEITRIKNFNVTTECITDLNKLNLDKLDYVGLDLGSFKYQVR